MIDDTPLCELDAYQLREIYFPGFGPTSGYQKTQLWRADVVDASTVIVVGYTGEVSRGLCLASGRDAVLRRDSVDGWMATWRCGSSYRSRMLLTAEGEERSIEELKSWLRGHGGGA